MPRSGGRRVGKSGHCEMTVPGPTGVPADGSLPKPWSRSPTSCIKVNPNVRFSESGKGGDKGDRDGRTGRVIVNL